MERRMILEGKVALVTGSTSGIGLAIAHALGAQGARLMINGFGPAEDIERKCRELGAIHDGADLSDPAAIEAMMRRCANELGNPDILVNNAGIQHVSPVESFPVEKWDAIIAINLSAAFHTTRLALPAMKAKGWGRIINTASAHSLIASPNKSAYVAAKHGVAGFTKTVALEAAKDGVTANCISPGYVWTPLVENQIPDTMKARNLTREQVINDVLLAAQPTKRFVTPEQVASLALYLCREEARSITGANLSMDGGWTAARRHCEKPKATRQSSCAAGLLRYARNDVKRLLPFLLVPLSACAVIEQPNAMVSQWSRDWRQVATSDDRARLRDWRSAFVEA